MTSTKTAAELSRRIYDPESGPASETSTDLLERLTVLLAAADAAEDAGRLDEMTALARDGLAQAEAAGATDQVIDFCMVLGRRCYHDENWQGMIAAMERGLAWFARSRDHVVCVRLAGLLALAYCALLQFDRAFGLMRRMRKLTAEASGEATFMLAAKQGELYVSLGQMAQAVPYLREALSELDTCSDAHCTPRRYSIVRLLLASALLQIATAEREANALNWAVSLDEALLRLDEAERKTVQVPTVSVPLIAARGYCLTLLGKSDPVLKARFIGASTQELGLVPAVTERCIFDWAAEEAALGDVAFGHAVLAKLEQRYKQLTKAPLWSLWFRTMGNVLAAEGDLAGSVQALRQSITEDRRVRDRELAIVVAMAERAAHTDEIEEREQAARDRADRLAVTNASLAAETQRWSESALTDLLTGLRNRRGLEQLTSVARSAGQGVDWTTAMIDIDHFKSVNDQYSHAIGDRVLAAVGQILAATVRGDDMAARWGGEEFVLLLHGRVSEARLDEIRRSVELFDWASILSGRNITISLGAAIWTADMEFSEALTLADQRLYAAKRSGRNRVVVS